MADSEDTETTSVDTYTPRTTRTHDVELEAPHGEMRTLRFRVFGGITYEVIGEEEAKERGLNAPVDHGAKTIQRKAAEEARA